MSRKKEEDKEMLADYLNHLDKAAFDYERMTGKSIGKAAEALNGLNRIRSSTGKEKISDLGKKSE